MKNSLSDACEKALFYLFVFLIPFQIGKFIGSFGLQRDFFYGQEFIYLSDLFIISLIGFWLIRIFKNKQKDVIYKNTKKEIFLIVFFLVSGVSILASVNKFMAVSHFIRLSEFLLLYFYIKNNFSRFNNKYFSYAILSSALLQVVIASLQFYYQESLGIRHFGESVISPLIQNVAKINEDGFKLLRAYGTFPHPNVFAAFLSFALFLPYYLYLGNKAEIRQKSVISPLPYYRGMRQMALDICIFFFLIGGLLLSFSRIAIISFIFVSLAMLVFFYFSKNKKNIEIKRAYKIIFLTAMVFVLFLLIFNKELFSRLSDSDSIAQRIFYIDIFKDAIVHSPVFGVGIGNFIGYFYSHFPDLPEWQYQPVHNLFLLIIAETGIVGGLSFILFMGYNIYAAAKKDVHDLFKYVILFVIADFLIIANFDHYFWTLQQGQILFWMILGINGSLDLLANKNNTLSSE